MRPEILVFTEKQIEPNTRALKKCTRLFQDSDVRMDDVETRLKGAKRRNITEGNRGLTTVFQLPAVEPSVPYATFFGFTVLPPTIQTAITRTPIVRSSCNLMVRLEHSLQNRTDFRFSV